MALFGVVCDAFGSDEWSSAVDLKPDVLALFEHWYRQRTLEKQFTEARRQGYSRMMITWEPWTPVWGSAELQGAYQNDWSNDAIASGKHDSYISGFASSIRDSGLSHVYIRLMHEMNGNWYPWYHDANAFVAAWKRIHLLFQKKNCDNVRWLWAPNPSLYQDKPRWLRDATPYWPGDTKVHYVGSTMIDFGGSRDYSIEDFSYRFTLMKYVFGKSAIAAEFNVAADRRDTWLRDFASWVRDKNPLYMAVLSQGDSRAAASEDTGDLTWKVTDDSLGASRIRQLADALRDQS